MIGIVTYIAALVALFFFSYLLLRLPVRGFCLLFGHRLDLLQYRLEVWKDGGGELADVTVEVHDRYCTNCYASNVRVRSLGGRLTEDHYPPKGSA